VIQKLLRKARKGTRVIFIPGNHDEFARKYLHHNFGGIDVAEEWIHEAADGRKLWVMHGDLFDGVIQCAKWLAHVGDSLYEFTLKLNRHLNSLRARMGRSSGADGATCRPGCEYVSTRMPAPMDGFARRHRRRR